MEVHELGKYWEAPDVGYTFDQPCCLRPRQSRAKDAFFCFFILEIFTVTCQLTDVVALFPCGRFAIKDY